MLPEFEPSTDKNLKIPRYLERTVAFYIRVSDPKQLEKFSVPTQIAQSREYAKREKMREVGIFIEKGQSAKTSDRTELQNLLHFITKNKNKVDYVLVYKIDRWARNSMDYYALKTILLKNGTNLISLIESQVDDSPTGRFLESLFSAVAQLDNENKGIRVRECMRSKALDGHYPGKPYYGYKNHPKSKILVRDLEYYEHIKNALIDFSLGTTIPELVERFRRAGLRTKGWNKTPRREFNTKDIWKILTKSRFYAGYFDWGEVKDQFGKHETMITWKQHTKIQSLLYQKSQCVSQELIQDEPYFIFNFNLTGKEGFVHCNICNSRLRSCFSKGKMGTRYPYYYCYNKNCTMDKKSIKKHELEQLFEVLLQKITPSEKFANLFKHSVVELWEKEHAIYDERHKHAEKKLDDLKDKKDYINKMHRTGRYSDEEYDEEIALWKNEMAVVRLEINENLIDRNELEVLLVQAELFITRLEPLYRSFSTENKRRFSTLIFPKGVRYENGKIEPVEKSTLFEYLGDLQAKNVDVNQMVTSRGIEPRLPG